MEEYWAAESGGRQNRTVAEVLPGVYSPRRLALCLFVVAPTLKPEDVETRLFIDGEFVEATSGSFFDNVNPATEEVICKVQEAR